MESPGTFWRQKKWSLLVLFGGRKNGVSWYFLKEEKWSLLVLFEGRKMESPGTFWRQKKWSLLVLFGGRKNEVSWYFLEAEKMESPGTFWRQKKTIKFARNPTPRSIKKPDKDSIQSSLINEDSEMKI
jgi:hypothetical protein